MRRGEIDRPRAIFEALEAKAAVRGDEVTRTMLLWYRSLVDWYAGHWRRALAIAAEATEVGQQAQFAHNPAWVGRVRGVLEADLGLVEAARVSASDALEASRGDEYFTVQGLAVLGRLELELGNMDVAASHLRDLPGRLLAGGLNDPALPIWADAVEALISRGEFDQARAYLDAYDLHARRIGNPWAIAAAARCLGLLSAAERDLDSAFTAFDRALMELGDRPYPLERGRTLLCLGTVRRQAGERRAARDALEEAYAIFVELGARLWAEKAQRELRRISGRREASELTETELQVATLAAEGRTNKAIAAELYMGLSTVEARLSHVYRKLGVRRAGLARRLTVDPADTSKPVVAPGQT
jgi:ATP/maltotriose-dependent transcriptional regulator MalT